MTLLYDALLTAPATHVLAIGVGKYPHLVRGDGGPAVYQLGLGQLGSPPVSAGRFIDWCLSPVIQPDAIGFVNDEVPLGSVEALVSAAEPMIVQTPTGAKFVDRASRHNIQAAFMDWRARVASHPDNIGVFYFAGHGFMVSEDYLLAEDYGDPAKQPWENAFNVTGTFNAMKRVVTGTLYFFIDACRGVSREKALESHADPQPLLTATLKEETCKSSTRIHATGEGHRAFARVGGGVARFTDALVTALSGYCGDRLEGVRVWAVNGYLLAEAVGRLLTWDYVSQMGAANPPPEQFCQTVHSGSAVPLVRPRKAPKVKVELRLTPEQKRRYYRFYLESLRGDRYVDPGFPLIYQTEVPKGYYEVGAKAQGDGISPIEPLPDEDLKPPVYRPAPMVAR